MKMTKWEYKVVHFEEHVLSNAAVDQLNALGAEGWELVDVEPSVAILKRPVQS